MKLQQEVTVPLSGAPVDFYRFEVTVSHKEGRPDEEICFVKWIGTGAAMSEQWTVLKLHHELLLANGLTKTPFSDLVEALEAHLQVPPEDYSCCH